MALTNTERQKKHYLKQKSLKVEGKQRLSVMLPIETATRINTLSTFKECDAAQIVVRAINDLWEIRTSYCNENPQSFPLIKELGNWGGEKPKAQPKVKPKTEPKIEPKVEPKTKT